jgi:hypothetical protein
MKFRVKDLLISTIDEVRDQGQGGDTYCPTPGPCTFCSCTNCSAETLYCKNTECCCPGWTAPGTTKFAGGHALTGFHLSALRAEVRAAVAAEFRRSKGEVVPEEPQVDPLQELETKLSEALEEVKTRRKEAKK